jgi:hypothetical protein
VRQVCAKNGCVAQGKPRCAGKHGALERQELGLPDPAAPRPEHGLCRLGDNMMPTQQVCLERIQFCISDLSQNGIDVAGADSRLRARLVREHLEYFQLMLGYDSDPAEILDLLKRQAARG